ALAGRIEARLQHHEAPPNVVVVAADLHAAVEPLPGPSTVAAGVEADDVTVVAQAHDHALAMRIGRSAALDAVLVGDEVLGIEAQAAVEFAVIEQDQAGADAGVDLDLALDLIGLIAVDEDQR